MFYYYKILMVSYNYEYTSITVCNEVLSTPITDIEQIKRELLFINSFYLCFRAVSLKSSKNTSSV